MSRRFFSKSVLTLLLLVLIAGAGCQNQAVSQPPATSTLPAAPSTLETPESTPAPVLPTLAPSATPRALSALERLLPKLPGTTITFWHIWDEPVTPAIQVIVREFNQSNPYGITANAVAFESYNALYAAVNDAVSAGDSPDLVVGINHQFADWVGRGFPLLLLDPYVADPGLGLPASERLDFYPAIWDQDVYASERLGLPILRSAQVIFYNNSLARELGFETAPTTPEELLEQACAASAVFKQDSDAKNDYMGGWLANTQSATLLGWLYAFEAEVEPSGGGYSFDTPESQAAFTYMKTMFTEGCAWQPEARYPNEEFSLRQGLFYPSSLAGLPYQLDAFQDANNPDEWTILPYMTTSGTPVMPVFGPSAAIFETNPEEQLAAWLFTRHLVSPEIQAQLVIATGALPVRVAPGEHLQTYSAEHSQWNTAYSLLPFARSEPRQASWQAVRAVLEDAGGLVYSDFPIENLSYLLAELQLAAEEVHAVEAP